MRVAAFAVAALLAAPATASAAGVTSVEAPKRVKAGGAVKVVVHLDPVELCSLVIAGEPHGAVADRVDRITFTFRISRRTRPGRYPLTVRCGGTRRLHLTITRGKGKPGTVRRLVARKIGMSIRELTPPRRPGPASSFRAVYALAADQTETPGHVDAIKATVEAVNGWFATQTIGNVQPRWMRDAAGAPEVTVVRLPRARAVYEGEGGFRELRFDLMDAAPLAAPTQKTVVYTQTKHPTARVCGQYEYDVSWIAEDACDIHPVAPALWPTGATYLTAHELAHSLGTVPACAPHATGDGHTGDDPRDLLYAGPLPRAWDALMLDPGHDDYYGTGSSCGDAARSPFWTLTPDPRS